MPQAPEPQHVIIQHRPDVMARISDSSCLEVAAYTVIESDAMQSHKSLLGDRSEL